MNDEDVYRQIIGPVKCYVQKKSGSTHLLKLVQVLSSRDSHEHGYHQHKG